LIRAIGWATAAGVCVLAIPAALAQSAAPGVETAPRPPAAHAKALPQTRPELSALPAAPAWPREEIEAAQARCTAMLRGLDVVAAPEAAIHEGIACGAPAPMKLISIGTSPEIALSPPPTVTCDLIAALHKWLLKDVQPLARTHLGAPVIRIETMSSYSCRNAYGRLNGRLSEHARANAVDIGLFTTAHGDNVLIAADWGPTAREIAAAARAAAEARAATERTPEAVTAASHDRRENVGEPAAVLSPQPEPIQLGWRQPDSALGTPGLTLAWPGGRTLPIAGPIAGSLPNRLGGPKAPSTSTAAPPVLAGNKTDFLRGVHSAACKVFGTVLGPEANRAHKNHFHVDMAERKVMVICE
jgi:hypothetical protein